MTPQTVNAYYDPTYNTINFPAAILQPPFFYAKGDDAINYGGIGAVIGHESSHGFDDQGSQFDGHGNRANWWTPQDKKKFDARTGALVKQFDGYAPITRQARPARQRQADAGREHRRPRRPQYRLRRVADRAEKQPEGSRREDRRQHRGPALLPQLRAGLARHRSREDRGVAVERRSACAGQVPCVRVAPSNMPQFAQAFQCKPGDKMVRPATSS